MSDQTHYEGCWLARGHRRCAEAAPPVPAVTIQQVLAEVEAFLTACPYSIGRTYVLAAVGRVRVGLAGAVSGGFS